GDGGYKDDQDYIFITGRVDDVINVAGHRLSTSTMEEIVAMHPAVAECAVVGIDDSLRGQVPHALIVLKIGQEEYEHFKLQTELVTKVREQVGAVAVLKTISIVKRLPKTRSGKILRKTMRAMIDGKDYTIPSTIEDPIVLDELIEQ